MCKKFTMWCVLFTLMLTTACSRRAQPAESPLAPVSPLPTSPPYDEVVDDEIVEAIIFKSDRDGSKRYYTMTPNGTNVQVMNLGEWPENARMGPPIWSHALNKFLLKVDLGSDSDIYVINRDGSGLVNLTNTPLQIEAHPIPSPNGEYIAFVAVESDLDIFVMRSDGSERLNLTRHPARDVDPRWSPDGKRIIFVSNKDVTPNVFIVNRDGSDLSNLSQGPGQDSSASWSPDGRKIVFQSDRDGKMDIYTIDADGSNPVNLTDQPDRDVEPLWSNVEPLWSPDGQLIAFRSDRDGGWDLSVMKADGTAIANLTKSPELEELGMSWAPDSSHLVYTAQIDGQFEVFVIGVDGSPPVNLTNNPADDFAPLWVQF